ncbi:MAG TPA: TRAM domain-containing protein [Candidatus Pristimantibacillus sp.]|jgi:uncharacterized protein YacL|nr:TRAM domain-containing protein [Candidatus Pristimantibacillus sp.]
MLQILQLLLLLAILGLLLGAKTGKSFRLFSKPHQVILDSCALIDGRIAEIVRTGFINSDLIIPQFILSELQLLADGNDSHKRERARYGLDIAHELQDSLPSKVKVDRTLITGVDTTDDKLVALAKKLEAQLYTTDYNLAKVAAVEGVQVLNVNELSHSLRPITLPGETLNIKIIQKGSNREQGVGYLDDGTMIVIEGGARYVGREVPVSVTRMHQTVAGKMVFGQVKEQRRAPAAAPAKPEQPSQNAKNRLRMRHLTKPLRAFHQ